MHRQKLSVEGEKATLADETTVAEAAFNAGKGRPLSRTEPSEVVLTVKDLGRQVSWRTVFLVEYVRLLPQTFMMNLDSFYPNPNMII